MDAIGAMSKSVLGLAGGLTAAATGVMAAVLSMASSGEKMYYLSQRIGDSVKDVDALAFAFSKLGLSPEQAISNIRAMADAVHNSPYIRSLWKGITGSDQVNSESLSAFGDYYRKQTSEYQRYIRTVLLPQFDLDFYKSLERGGPGGGVGQFNSVMAMFRFDPDFFAKQSVLMENAWRDLSLRFTAIWGHISTPLVEGMTQAYTTLTAFIDAHADDINRVIDRTFTEITKVTTGAVEMAQAIMGFFKGMTDSQTEVVAAIGAIGLAFMSPGFFRIAAIAYALETLLKDYAAFRETGKSPLGIPWEEIGKGLDTLKAKLGELNDLTGGLITPWHALEAFIGLKLISTVGSFFTAVVAGAGTAATAVTTTLGGAFAGILTILTRLGPLLFLLGLGQMGGELSPAEQDKLEREHGFHRKPGVPLYDQFGKPIPGSASPGTAIPSEQTGPGVVSKMWHGFWESIVGSAHAEELPPNIKMLSQNVIDLNDTLSQMLDQQMIAAGMKAAGDNLGGGGGSGGGGISRGVNSPEAAAAVRFFMSKGWTLPQAIGIVSNLLAESGLNPQAENASHHVGVAQWDQTRQQAFRLKYGHTVKEGTLDEQLDFVDDELHNSHAAAGRDLSRQVDPRGSAFSVNRNYEISDDYGVGRQATADALTRNPAILNNTNNAGHSVTSNAAVTINAPSGDANAIAGAWDEYNKRHWADVQRNLQTPLY